VQTDSTAKDGRVLFACGGGGGSVRGRAVSEYSTEQWRAPTVPLTTRSTRTDAAPPDVRIVSATAASVHARRCGSPATGPRSVSLAALPSLADFSVFQSAR